MSAGITNVSHHGQQSLAFSETRLLSHIPFIHLWHARNVAHVSDDNLQELGHSFYQVGLGVELRSFGLAASTGNC